MFKNIGFSCGIKVVSTERAYLAAKLGDSPGILLLSGEDVSGYIWRGDNEVYAGNYGRLVETGGSAYSIGANALRRVVLSLDGRGPDTGLAGMAARELGVKEPADILGVVNSDSFETKKIADLAGLVEKAAKDGDGTALEIEAQAGRDLASFASILITKAQLKGERIQLLMGGPVLLLNENIARQTSANLRSKFPDIQILLADEKTELGAAMLAR
jgi:N-acetylglucosamine kinase-like BadF-type ATPase